jgi:hypothetical protein
MRDTGKAACSLDTDSGSEEEKKQAQNLEADIPFGYLG